jgi:hypothetical protein
MILNVYPELSMLKTDRSNKAVLTCLPYLRLQPLPRGCFLSSEDYTNGDFGHATLAISQATTPAFSKSKGVIA